MRDPAIDPEAGDIVWNGKIIARVLAVTREKGGEFDNHIDKIVSEEILLPSLEPCQEKMTCGLLDWLAHEVKALYAYERDPFKEPKAGDMFWEGGYAARILRVTGLEGGAGLWVSYSTCLGNEPHGDDGQVKGKCPLEDWPERSKGLILLRTADGFTLTESEDAPT